MDQLVTKYSVPKIRDIKGNSKDEISFKTILNSFISLIKLAGRIELLTLMLPIIRENFFYYNNSEMIYYEKKVNSFIEDFLTENFVILEEKVKTNNDEK